MKHKSWVWFIALALAFIATPLLAQKITGTISGVVSDPAGAVKSFVPVIAISSDRTLTSTNIPWIFRLPEGTALERALLCLAEAVKKAGPNRGNVRNLLASGSRVAGVSFDRRGEPIVP